MAINKLAIVQQNGNYTVEYWNKFLLGMVVLEQKNFVFSTLGKQVSIPKNYGTKTISLRRYNSLPVSSDLSAEKLAEGVAPTPLLIEAQKVQGTINQFGAYIEITDWVDEINEDDVKSIYMPELARHAAEVTERDVISSFDDASEWFVAGKTSIDAIKSGSTEKLTLQEVRKASLVMKNHRRNGHVKFGGKPVLVVHPNVMQDLLDDTDLKDRVLVPGNDNSPIKSGTLEQYKIYGFYIVETLIAEVVKNAATPVNNVYVSYLLGRDPYVVIGLGGSNTRWLSTGFGAEKTDPLGQKATFGYKLWTGAKVIDPIAITKIYSASAYDLAFADDFADDAIARSAIQKFVAKFAATGITGDAPATKTGTSVYTAALLDADGVAVTAADFDTDAYSLVWSSEDATFFTVAWTSAITATVTGVKNGTKNLTCKLYKNTGAGKVLLDTEVVAVIIPS